MEAIFTFQAGNNFLSQGVPPPPAPHLQQPASFQAPCLLQAAFCPLHSRHYWVWIPSHFEFLTPEFSLTLKLEPCWVSEWANFRFSVDRRRLAEQTWECWSHILFIRNLGKLGGDENRDMATSETHWWTQRYFSSRVSLSPKCNFIYIDWFDQLSRRYLLWWLGGIWIKEKAF